MVITKSNFQEKKKPKNPPEPIKPSFEEKLAECLAIQTYSEDNNVEMMAYVVDEMGADCAILSEADYFCFNKGKEEMKPMIFCQIDTMFKCFNDVHMFNDSGRMFGIDSQTLQRVGIGLEKVGLFIAVELAKRLDNCFLFVSSTSISPFIDMKHADILEHASYFIEPILAEHGWVLTETYQNKHMFDKDFALQIEQATKEFKFREVGKQRFQTLYDWSSVKTSEICCLATSTGYYESEHDDYDYVQVEEVRSTIEYLHRCVGALSSKKEWLNVDTIMLEASEDDDDEEEEIGHQWCSCEGPQLVHDEWEDRYYCMLCHCYRLGGIESVESDIIND